MRVLLILLLLWLPAWAQETLEVPIFEGAEGLRFFQECAREYERQRPGVTVDLYGDPRIADKVRVRILEGSFPEVTNANLNYGALLRHGDLYCADAMLDGPAWDGHGTWRDSFLPGTLDRYTVNGKTYGVPFMNTCWALWYNRQLFAAHGWQPPTTWAEFFRLGERIKAAGLAPVAFQGRYTYYAQPILDHNYYQLAGRTAYYAQKELQPGSFDNPEYIQALALLQQAAREDFQSGALGMSHTEAQLEFFQGRAAMIFCGSWLEHEMQGNIPDDFELGVTGVPLPAGPHVDPHALQLGSGYYFVLSRSAHPERGLDFLRFMTSRQMARRFSQQNGMLVAVKGVNSGTEGLSRLVETATTTFSEAPGEGFPGMVQPLADARFALLSGSQTPAQIARELEGKAAVVRSEREHPDQIRYRHKVKPLLLLAFLVLAALNLKRGAASIPRGRPAPRSSLVLFLGPALLLYAIFIAAPSLTSFGWSLTRWDGLTSMLWVGLLNFQRLLFESDAFWVALTNNLFLMVVVPALVLPWSLFLAHCLSQGVHGSRLFRVIFFFPNLLGVGGVLLWQQIYHPNGPLNRLLGWEGFTWLSQDHLYWALVPMSVWGAAGFNMVLFLAAMESVPTDLYEAADLEGASRWQQFWFITLPLIWDTLTVAVVFMLIGGMKAFETIWLLTNQTPTTQTHVIGTLMVSTMFAEFRLGEATAIAVLLFLLVFAGTSVTQRVLRREGVEL